MRTSDDCFLRMTIDDVLALPFTHLISGLDDESPALDERCGARTTLTGYTEWIASTEPPVTVGWDWLVADERWLRIGPPRSNLLLLDSARHPYAWARNEAVLGTVVDALPWQEETKSAVNNRYC
jgi:hypothetical protein